ncbi:hypothetical protein NQ176_g3666 [Zarea fungicola]|uniref:Uncharacterized protein n=1 Tax=Zarea fungicola TaxID=93591 RepID=A0ACC1NJW2_9HYPO|nr:hypothetical protein NQ176_g3666 [Lecanicillium fungicola]
MTSERLLLLGCHKTDWLRLLKDLLTRASDQTLSDFLQQATRLIQREIKLDSELYCNPDLKFSTIHELADRLESLQADCPLAVRLAVISMSQIGHILAFERGQPILFSDAPLTVSGHGIGSIAAAAFAASRFPTQLAHLGEQAIILAFHVGSCIERKMASVTGFAAERGELAWGSITLPHVPEQVHEMLADINQRQNLLPSHASYVSSTWTTHTVASDPDLLWELLQAGLDVHQKVPPDRFDHVSHTDPTGRTKNSSKTPYGCFLDDAGLFDNAFFNMSAKEAAQTDPAQRLMLLTAYEALEMSGFVPNRTPSSMPDRVATFYGQASDDWRETNSSQSIGTYFIPGGIRAFGPGRINYHLKFSGPSYCVDTACSSSFAAIHMAFNSLLANDCDTAVVGGANILTNPDIFAGLSRAHFLSTTGSCKTFDAEADGYCRGDGVGSVVMKRLEDAVNDNDRILGVILGVATNHSADAVSITHPHAPTQASLYRSILNTSRIRPTDVDYVEMHGTGTVAVVVGDYNEVLSVSDVFAPRERPKRESPLHLSSIKSNIGHGEAAAGIASLIKVLLMLQNGIIPPHVGIKSKLNPTFPQDLTERNVHIPIVAMPWPRSNRRKRLAFLNNFSAAGGNTSLLLTEYRSGSAIRSKHSQSVHVITNPDTNLADLGYTLTSRRVVYGYRMTFPASGLEEARETLLTSGLRRFNSVAKKPGKVIFTFTGQSSAYTSLAMSLFKTCTSFQSDVLEFDAIAKSHRFPSFLELIDGSADDLASLSPLVLHVGQVSVQVALARLWCSWGIRPSAVIGHSLGEYPALVMAGVLSVSDMIYIVGRRCQLLLEMDPSRSCGMLAVNASAMAVQSRLTDTAVEIACVNSATKTVLGGPTKELNKLACALRAQGITHTRLEVSHAFHTVQVDDILTSFLRVTDGITFNNSKLPVISPLLSIVVAAGSNTFNAEYLGQQMRSRVDFYGALSSAQKDTQWTDSTTWLEIGPHPTCIHFVRQTLGDRASVAKSLHRDQDAWETMAATLCNFHDAGYNINWEKYNAGLGGNFELIQLPPYGWDLKNFWINYENNWSLTKGEGCDHISDNSTLHGTRSFSIHKIFESKAEGEQASLNAETDFTEPSMTRFVAGHRVNGVALCPSSLYVDMALTVAGHLFQQLCPDNAVPAMDVCNMEVLKPFLLSQKDNHMFITSAEATIQRATVQFYTVDKTDQSKRTDHAKCEVHFEELDAWKAKWMRTSYLVEQRLDALDIAADAGNAHRLPRELVYQKFGAFVDYDTAYQGLEEIVLHSESLEASAKVVLQPTESGFAYQVPPTWVDSLCHLTGAILHISDALDKTYVFISHGWESIRLVKELRAGATYRTYARMQEVNKGLMEGNVWIFMGKTVVGVVEGIKFQRMPRRLIDTLLPQNGVHTVPVEGDSDLSSARWQIPGNTTQRMSQQSSKETIKSRVRLEHKSSVLDSILSIIATECGISLDDLTDDCSLYSLGIDSLLTLEILARVRIELGLDLRSDSFFENETIGDLRAYCEARLSAQTANQTLGTLNTASSKQFVGNNVECLYSTNAVQSNCSNGANSSNGYKMTPSNELVTTHASSYLVSGNLQIATKYLFLFPDGSGSATSYASIFLPDADVAVFALNCPYMKNPSLWQGGIWPVIKLYLDEIYRRQPHGPYNLGGWSAGGILAYEAVQQLQSTGSKVDRLILIDAPCPVGLSPMPSKFFSFLGSVGLLGRGNGVKVPDWVIPHFEATVRNVNDYVPAPVSPGQEPVSTLIWARDGLTAVTGGKRPAREPGDPEVMEWLLENRSDFQFNGWDALISAAAICCEVMDGNHFNIVNVHARKLSELLAKAML